MKKGLENAVEDAVLEAERMAKHGRHAMEDMIEDTTYRVLTRSKGHFHFSGKALLV